MKEFLLLFRGGDQERRQLSPEQIEAHVNRWQDWIRNLAEQNHFVSGQPLVSDGKVLQGTQKKLTDGPFMEGKEIVGGFVVLRAADMEAAVLLAQDCPNLEAESGLIEIREIGTLHV
jgi:hypothetical protein